MRTFGFVFIALVWALSGGASHAEEWGCYDPKPGHPTAAERAAFIDEVSRLAVDAERQHGIPAAAIAAMAMVESGYGWTRTAIDASNLFGWKFTTRTSAGGRDSYELTCQPPEDVNNHYVVFRDRAEAMDFVAGKLATLSYYRADKDAYQNAIFHGGDVTDAVKAWITGISDPYNWKPAEYTRTVIRIMNNPVESSDTISPDTNLYRLSETATQPSPTSTTTSTPLPIAHSDADDIAYAMTMVEHWTGHCDAPILNYSRWAGFPVTLCEYTDIGATVKTYMLNADAPKLARWAVTACEDAHASDMHGCIKHMARVMSGAASGNVFPVAGFIPEPENGGLCYLFRDGVTVTTERRPHQLKPDGATCAGDEDDQPISRARVYARIASTTRDEYRAAGGTSPVGSDGDVRWLDVVRDLYQKAWTSERNELISATAIQAKKDGWFH